MRRQRQKRRRQGGQVHWHRAVDMGMFLEASWLVVSIPLNYISQLGDYPQYMGKSKMFQTTNQLGYPDANHGAGIVTYSFSKNDPNVSRYSIQ